MIEGILALLIAVIVIGIVVAIIMYIIDLIPMDGRFKQIAKVLVMLVACLVLLMKGLPLLGVSGL